MWTMNEFPRKLDPSPSITAEQLRIITLRVALKRAAVVRVFFPSLPHPFHPHPSDFRGLVAVWSILRGDESDGDTRGGEGGGGRGCDASKGLYGYLNTFVINSRERVLEARSRPRNAPILLPFLFSFCPRLSPLPPSPPRIRCVCTYGITVEWRCRAFRPIRGSLARLEWPSSLLPVFENATEQ